MEYSMHESGSSPLPAPSALPSESVISEGDPQAMCAGFSCRDRQLRRGQPRSLALPPEPERRCHPPGCGMSDTKTEELSHEETACRSGAIQPVLHTYRALG